MFCSNCDYPPPSRAMYQLSPLRPCPNSTDPHFLISSYAPSPRVRLLQKTLHLLDIADNACVLQQITAYHARHLPSLCNNTQNMLPSTCGCCRQRVCSNRPQPVVRDSMARGIVAHVWRQHPTQVGQHRGQRLLPRLYEGMGGEQWWCWGDVSQLCMHCTALLWQGAAMDMHEHWQDIATGTHEHW